MPSPDTSTYRILSWNLREIPRYLLAPWLALWILAAAIGGLAGASLRGDWLPLVGVSSLPLVVAGVATAVIRCRVVFDESGIAVYNIFRRVSVKWSNFRRLEPDIRPWVSGGVVAFVFCDADEKERKIPMLAVPLHRNDEFADRLVEWFPDPPEGLSPR